MKRRPQAFTHGRLNVRKISSLRGQAYALPRKTMLASFDDLVAARARIVSGLGTSLVYLQVPSIEFPTIKCRSGSLGGCIVSHFHEAEALGSTGVAVHYDVQRDNLAILSKQGSKIFFLR